MGGIVGEMSGSVKNNFNFFGSGYAGLEDKKVTVGIETTSP